MNIRDRREIRQAASHALATVAGNPRRVALVYGGILCLLSLVSTLISFYLNAEIAGTGGLSNMGLRSVLSTIQAVLPFLQIAVTLGLELGYAAAMLNIARGRSAEPRDLLGGFRKFLPMAVSVMWQIIICSAAIIAALYVSCWIFMFLPSYDAFLDVIEPVLESMTTMSTAMILDDATLAAAMEAMIPMLRIFAVLAAIVLIPITYQYRMVTFCLADAAGYLSGLGALRESRRMMRRNRFQLFRLDLGFWWYYLLQVLISLVCYGDALLPMFGITLPWSQTASYFVFLILSLALQLGVYVLCMNRVTVTYATAYDALRPKPQKGVALGSIFDM